MSRLVVAVDFDRCLINDIPSLSTDYSFRENAKETILKLSSLGVEFILNTSRYGWYYKSAVKFLKKERLPITIKRFRNKIPANIYIDDCNIFCRKIDWFEIEKELINQLKKYENAN